MAAGGAGISPQLARAAALKVVIVVGPTGTSRTIGYISEAKLIAKQARSYGATVYEIYSPNATWARVAKYAAGANLLVYLGHGNGWPSPYAPFQTRTKDGMGLNATANNGHNNTKYYGEAVIASGIHLAANSAVLLNRLCYASGNPEWGRPAPTKAVAQQRVDNFGAGFLRTGAKVVFAQGINSTAYILYGLFKTQKTMSQIFWTSPNAVRTKAFTYTSVRTPGAKALLDPTLANGYYRSVVGNLNMTAATWR
jgi:hypothetical protein